MTDCWNRGLCETLLPRLLRDKITELQQKIHKPKIIILGDFNDQPYNESMSEYLGCCEMFPGILKTIGCIIFHFIGWKMKQEH